MLSTTVLFVIEIMMSFVERVWGQMWSPSFIPTPKDYGDHIDVIGNVFPPIDEKALSWVPPPDLLHWLFQKKADGSNDAPIFIGFGSMIIKVRAVVFSTSSGVGVSSWCKGRKLSPHDVLVAWFIRSY